MVETLDERTWSILLERINKRRCLPFLGAGASFPALPLASNIAADWAREYNYPGDNPKNLTEVAQYLAVEFDPPFPKNKILEVVNDAGPPDFNAADEPHGVLADLPLPIYLTTNYDDFMVRALKSRHRDARRELCRWYSPYKSLVPMSEEFYPTVANPLVFHLHGHTTPESIVITEDDYLCFLSSISDHRLIPVQVQRALSEWTWLFIGYRLADWNFRVLFQSARRFPPRFDPMGGMSIAVLKPPGDDELARRQKEYLDKYYATMKLEVYWGTARDFAAELRERWNKFSALESKRLELTKREALQPRRLTEDQKQSLVKLLSGKVGVVTIVSSLLNAESSEYANDFHLALSDAGWKTARIKNRTAPTYGVSIATVEGTEPLEHARWLSDALQAIGVQHEIRLISGQEVTTISPNFEQGYLYLLIDNYSKSATANDVYAFVAQLKTEAEKRGNSDFASELDDALHFGSSGLEILGAIRKTLVENHREVESLLGSDGWKKAAKVIAFVDKAFGR
jgi:hypothetical protein